MKLSNKILLGFFGTAFLYLTAVFAELRLTGVPNIINEKNSVAETVDLSGVEYIIFNNIERNIKIIDADQPRIEVRSLSGDLLKNLKHTVSNGTLTMSAFESEDAGAVRITVFIPEGKLKGITVNASSATVKGFDQEVLHLSQNAGHVWMSEVNVGSLQLDLSNRSSLDLSGSHVDTLSARIDDSHALIFTPVGFVQGALVNNSSLRLSSLREIQLKKDESSHLGIIQ
jgi:hypothetical protein